MVKLPTMTKEEWIHEFGKLIYALLGATLYAASINLFIVPAKLYDGGIMGISLLLRTILVDFLHFSFPHFDITGIIYYMINIPILLIAFNKIGKKFFLKTLACISWITLAMSIIPIPGHPILETDLLGTCFIGGLLAGFGVGTMLKMGASGGGMDIIGMMLIKWKKTFSVGKVSLFVNLILYTICLLLFDIPIVIYSLIFASISSFTIDKVHAQNINVEVSVITKKSCEEMYHEIFRQLGRGITILNSTGAYTHEDSKILYILLSKYEVRHLKEIIRKYDPEAFIVVNEGVHIEGNYLVKL